MSAITMDTVRDLIERHSDHISGNTREFYNGAYAEIADELMREKDANDNRTTELLPCPFCGGEAALHPTYDMDTGDVDGWFAWCDNDTCECKQETGQFLTESEAIAAWNNRTPIEYEGWFYLPKPKEGIVDYGEPAITRTENGYKVRQIVDVVDEAARKWGEELGEYVMHRICEIWNSRAERTCKSVAEYAKSPLDGKTIVLHRCSVCHELMRPHMRYCPNCGARRVSE